MSWLFGHISNKPFETNELSVFHPEAVCHFHKDNYYIAAGGNKRLLYSGKSDLIDSFYICGLGISWDCDHILSNEDWSKILTDYPKSLDKLNGHFCGVLFKNNTVKFFSDNLGLRELYLMATDSGWYFSTRLDWLMKIQKCEIDYNIFASRWVCINQLSNKSIVKDVIRLNQGASAEIINDKIIITNRTWIPQITNPISAEEFSERLNQIILLGESEKENISLSLSGGMDSRVILSFLMKSGNKNWNCHTFNTDNPKDSIIAERMLTDFQIQYKLLGEKNLYDNAETDNLFEYIGSTFMTQSAFNSVKLMIYSGLPGNDIIIDGGFGEIWRREYLTLLNMRGRKFIVTKDYSKIAEFLSYNRANIFNQEIMGVMNEGVIDQINDVFNTLPDVNEVGFENWIDLFAIKTRLVNYFGPEQARMDNLVSSYMPFAQISLIDDILNLPLKERRKNKLFKKLILTNVNKLAGYNLVSGNVYYPFWFSKLQKRVYSRINSRFVKTNSELELDKFLLGKKEFIMDSILSESAKTYSPYNYSGIREKVSSYYNGGEW